LKREHVDALLKMYNHSMYWAEDIMWKFYLKSPVDLPVRILLKLFIRYAKRQVSKYVGKIEEYIKQ